MIPVAKYRPQIKGNHLLTILLLSMLLLNCLAKDSKADFREYRVKPVQANNILSQV